MSKPNLLDKAAYGAECNGCGQCCASEPCRLGAHVFQQKDGPCPALGQAHGTDPVRFLCGLVSAPEQFVPHLTLVHGKGTMQHAAKVLTGSGVGCDSRLDGEPASPGYNARLAALKESPLDMLETFAAMRLWGLELKP